MASNYCIGYGRMRIYHAVANEVLGRLQLLGIEAVLAATTAQSEQQYDSASISTTPFSRLNTRRHGVGGSMTRSIPDNRLVASELEQRWNKKLAQLHDSEIQRQSLIKRSQLQPSR